MFGADGQGLPGALHGTGVAGILAGNNPGSIRFQGMAPAATLFMVDYSLDSGLDWEGKSMLERVAWLKAQDVHIALWEMSSWATTFMDGTSNLEKAMDALYQENGILQVVPAGNLATARKHMQATLAPGTTGVRASVPEVLPGYGVPFEVPMILLAVYYKGQPDDLGLRIRVPGAAAVDIPIGDQNGTALPQGQAAIASTALSEAGIS